MRSFLALLLLASANGFLQPITPTRALVKPLSIRMDPNEVRLEFSHTKRSLLCFYRYISLTPHFPFHPSLQPPKTPEEPPPPAPKPRYPVPVPSVTGASGDQLDVVSRLLKDRILMLGTDVNDEVRRPSSSCTERTL